MGIKLFGVDIAGIVRKETKGKLQTLTLTKVTNTTRDINDLGGGLRPTTATHSCEGVSASFENTQVKKEAIRDGDRMILIIGDSLPSGIVPVPNDLITIDGSNYTIISADRDPAAATWMCHSRGPVT